MSTPTMAAAWRKTQPKATPPAYNPTPTLDPNRPKFTPGVLDEQGAANAANLDFGYQTASRGIEQNYTDAMADIDAQRPLIDKQLQQDYLSADNSAGARGMGQSGQHVIDRTRAAENADLAQRNLANAAARAANARQQSLDTESGNYNLAKTNNMIDSNVRGFNTFQSNLAGYDPSVQPVVKPKPAVSYKDWLKGRTSTSTLASAWKKKYGGNQ